MDYITTANVLLWFLLALGFFLMFLSHWLVAVSLFPGFVADCASQYRRPVSATLLGLLALVLPIVIGVAGLNVLPPFLKWIGLLIIFAPILGGLLGTAGLAHKIGQGMPVPGDHNQPWKSVLRGGTALALTFLLPILGQILAIPLVLASGLGASLLTWNARRRGRRHPVPPADVAPAAPAPAPAAHGAPPHIPALPALPTQLPS